MAFVFVFSLFATVNNTEGANGLAESGFEVKRQGEEF